MPRCARQWELVLCRGGCCMGASEAIGRCDAGGEHTSIHPDIPWAPALWQSVGRAVETVSDSPGCWGLGVEVAAVLRASHWAVDMPVRLQGPRSLTLISTLAGQASASHPAEEETGSEGLTRQRPGKLAPRADSVTLRGAVLLLSSLPRPARLRCAARTAVGPGSPFSKTAGGSFGVCAESSVWEARLPPKRLSVLALRSVFPCAGTASAWEEQDGTRSGH